MENQKTKDDILGNSIQNPYELINQANDLNMGSINNAILNSGFFNVLNLILIKFIKI